MIVRKCQRAKGAKQAKTFFTLKNLFHFERLTQKKLSKNFCHFCPPLPVTVVWKWLLENVKWQKGQNKQNLFHSERLAHKKLSKNFCPFCPPLPVTGISLKFNLGKLIAHHFLLQVSFKSRQLYVLISMTSWHLACDYFLWNRKWREQCSGRYFFRLTPDFSLQFWK